MQDKPTEYKKKEKQADKGNLGDHALRDQATEAQRADEDLQGHKPVRTRTHEQSSRAKQADAVARNAEQGVQAGVSGTQVIDPVTDSKPVHTNLMGKSQEWRPSAPTQGQPLTSDSSKQEISSKQAFQKTGEDLKLPSEYQGEGQLSPSAANRKTQEAEGLQKDWVKREAQEQHEGVDQSKGWSLHQPLSHAQSNVSDK